MVDVARGIRRRLPLLLVIALAVVAPVLSAGTASALGSPLVLKIEQLAGKDFSAADPIQVRFTATNASGGPLTFAAGNGLWITFGHFYTQTPQGSWTAPCTPAGWGDPGGGYAEDAVQMSLPTSMTDGESVTCTLTYTATAADVSNHGIYGQMQYMTDPSHMQDIGWSWYTLPAAGYSDTPVVTGTAVVGKPLSVTLGYWGMWDQSWTYQWLRDGTAIPGATSNTYTPVLGDASTRLSVTVTGTSASGSSIPKTTSATDPVIDPVERWAGKDRYSTAAAVSAHAFAPQVPVAFVASGVTFPDALAGAPVAVIRKGPVLLTAGDQLPSAVRAELSRLRPQSIVVLGGTGAVSAAVEAALAAYSPSVTRWQGANRYQTSAQIAARAFPIADCVYLVSGRNFPDALSAAPVAGMRNCPMLLADAVLDASVRAQIARLQPKQIYLVGGADVVSDAVRVAALAVAPGATATRVSGPDRYATSSAVSVEAFGTARLPRPELFLAAGATFPDALGAAPVAGIRQVPLLLTTTSALPSTIGTEVTRLQAPHAVVIAGPAAVSDTVVQTLAALLK